MSRKATRTYPTTGRILGCDPGSEYTPLELAYLKAVERLRKKVKFPTALDHFRLAREVLAAAGDPDPKR